jgi:hypothetical protein
VDRLQIELAAWIIQDGNYPDFAVEQDTRFALEFHPDTLEAASGGPSALERVGVAKYRVRAQVVWRLVDRGTPAWVIDFGLRAYQSMAPPEFAGVGAWVTGEIYLGIDHYLYFEQLYKLPQAPALIYLWHIHRIWMETTPWLPTTDSIGREVFIRDRMRESFVEVSRTDAWNDDGGNAGYLLECSRTGEPSHRI